MYIVMTSSAKMPSSCGGRYRNVAVVELEDGFVGIPTMISTHARGVKRVVRHYGPQSVGKTDRCAYARAFKAAQALADEMNG